MPDFQMPPLSTAPAASTPISDEQVESLLSKIQEFNDSANQFETQQTMNQQESEAMKEETIVQALQLLRDAGVNPSDPRSIAEYLQRLEEQEPDMAQIVKQALYSIFGGAPAPLQEPMVSSASPETPVEEEPMF